MAYFYGMKFPLSTMEDYVNRGWAIDATMGGLVLGRSHDEGGIYIWVKRDNWFVLEGEVEGYEFVLNPGASHYYEKSSDIFHQHDLHKTSTFEEYIPNDQVKLLDTKRHDEPKFLLFDMGGFSIINRYSTKGYLETLDKMNKAITFEQVDAKSIRIVKNSYEKIEVKFYDNLEGHFPPPKHI